MPIVPRSAWTTRAPSWTPARRGVPDVFVHHEGGATRGIPSNKAAVLREIESGVLGKGYIAIDYNLMVFNDGTVWEGRGLSHEDGATINNNPTSVSICAVGNYEHEPATDALIAGIAYAAAVAAQQGWTVAKPHIRPHREVFSTACPGAHLFARMNDIRTHSTAPTSEDDLKDDERIWLKALFDALVDDPDPKTPPHSLVDKVNWLTNWVKPGGYAARSDGKPSRIEAIFNKVILGK